MNIIPVIDLMGGQVVRGVAGRRSEYRPIESRIAASAAPAEVASALRGKFGFHTVYVADLDAIAGDEFDCTNYRAIGNAGLSIWLDGGIGNAERARALLDRPEASAHIMRLIAGLESLPDPAMLDELVSLFGPRLVFSLDLKAGAPLTSAAGWHGMTAEQIAVRAVEAGVSSLILLDLASVGMYQGTGTEALCQSLRRRYPELELIGGGGVRSMADVRRLEDAGFNAVLVASALHDGRITREDL